MITTGDGKFFSNGLDLEFLAKCSPEEAIKTVNGFSSLLLRLLTFQVPSIAALNGTVNFWLLYFVIISFMGPVDAGSMFTQLITQHS